MPVFAQAWEGVVLDVHDGDTLSVAPCGDVESPVSVRLYGVDAPELNQAGGLEARAALAGLAAAGTRVEVIPLGGTSYARIVALVMARGRSVQLALVRQGWAWRDPKRCRAPFCPALRRAEEQARKERRGLWADDVPVPPWEFRVNRGGKKA